MGGPSGGFLPPDAEYGARPGRSAKSARSWARGPVLVADERACIVDLATLMTRFLNDEACGKTIPCRIGTRRLAELGDRFVGGRPP